MVESLKGPALLLIGFLLALPSGAQESLNVDLLGRLDPYSMYSDIWGYRAPDGREYALVGANVGTSIVDCTDPRQPVERALVPGAITPLRDIKSFGTHVYVVNENSGGLQIIDMADPDEPLLLGTWGAAQFSHSHNLAIDQGTGWIYVAGTDVGTVIYDASVDPASPPLVGVYGTPNFLDYVHDLFVQDGVAHAAMVWAGEYRLLDVTTWPFAQLAAPFTAARMSHNVWVDDTNALAVTTDEQEAGLVQFWDIRSPTAPEVLSVYTPNTASVPHNAFLVGDRCHVSWYTEGYRVLDVSDPARPEEVGFYDMHSGPSGPQLGAFGCYPFQPSGNVYISDRTDGLFVLRPHRLRIHHDGLADTIEPGPYRVEADITAEAPIETAFLYWSTGGAFERIRMRPKDGFGDFLLGGPSSKYAAVIPAQSAPTTVSYYMTATDHGGGSTRRPWGSALYRFQVGERVTVYSNDFEGAQTWTHGGTSDDWQRGTPLGLGWVSRGVAWVDPWYAYSGSNAWGTDLGIAGSDGDYETNTANWLQSPAIPTEGVTGLRLRLRRWLTVEGGPSDRARILVNGQVVWQSTDQHVIDFDWNEVEIDVSSVLDSASTATLRFELNSDGDMELGGWCVDDVELYALVGG